jgi:hypothetical protein
MVPASEVTVRMVAIDQGKALRTAGHRVIAAKCAQREFCNVTWLASGGGARCAVGLQGPKEGVGRGTAFIVQPPIVEHALG